VEIHHLRLRFYYPIPRDFYGMLHVNIDGGRLLTSCGICLPSVQTIDEHQMLMDEQENEFGKKGDCFGTALPVAHHLCYSCNHDTAHRLWTAYGYTKSKIVSVYVN
jgi:hypothetical protein